MFISPGQEIEFACLAIDCRITKKKNRGITPLHKPVTVVEVTLAPSAREHYFFFLCINASAAYSL